MSNVKSPAGVTPKDSLLSWAVWLSIPIAILLISSFFIISHDVLVNKDNYALFQYSVFVDLNQAATALPAYFWSNLTMLGDAAVSILLFSLILIWKPQAWAALICSAPAAAILTSVGKNTFNMPRPAAVLDHSDFNIIGEALAAHNSFPSGHSIASFAVMVAILASILRAPKNGIGWLILTTGLMFAASMCFSRVAMGAHWPLDTVVGGAIGWIAGLSGAFWASKQQRWWQSWATDGWPRYLLGSILIIWSVFIFERLNASEDAEVVLIAAGLGGILTAAWMFKKYTNIVIGKINTIKR